jgi:pyrroloquinoline quinone (PQQ) biosynthesis protein C
MTFVAVLPRRPASLKESRLNDEAGQDCGSPAQYVDDLAQIALQHRAVNHPYLHAMETGAFPSLHGALADFAQHYHGYSAHFPRYLTALISKLENPDHRKALLENLMEESGQYEEEELLELKECGVQPEWITGFAHPELFKRFRNAIGVGDSAADHDHIEVVCWREQFLAILNTGSAAEALGALGLGTETIVQTIYQPFVAAINQLGSLKPEDAVFFPLHTAVDDHHQATLKAIRLPAISLPQPPAGPTSPRACANPLLCGIPSGRGSTNAPWQAKQALIAMDLHRTLPMFAPIEGKIQNSLCTI